MRATAIVPVKRFGAAKQRLSDALGPAARARLASAMLTDVLAALAECPSIERTLVVSSEPSLGPIAAAAGAELLDDGDDRGHSEAARAGVAVATESGAEAVALLPGDCPLLEPAELERALAGLEQGAVQVIADRHGTGTNGLLISPPQAIGPAFGPGSCERHLRLAAEAGLTASLAAVPSMALDLDTGDDLGVLADRLAAATGRAPASAAALADLRDAGQVPS